MSFDIRKDYGPDSDDEVEERAEKKIADHVRAQQSKATETKRAIRLDVDFPAWLAIGSIRSGATIQNYVDCATRAGRVVLGRQRGAERREALKAVPSTDPEVQSMVWMRLPPDEMWRYLKGYTESLETLKLTAQSVQMLSKYLFGPENSISLFWNEKVNRYSKLSDARRDLQLLGPREMELFVPHEQLEELVTAAAERILKRIESRPGKCSTRDARQLQGILLAALYVLMPPPRRDLCYLRIDLSDDHNSFDRVRSEIQYVKFKTSKVMGTVRVRVDNALVLQMIHALIDRCRNPGDTYLFVGKGGKPFASEKTYGESIGRIFNEICDRNLRPAMLRRIYLSRFVASAPSLIEQKRVARSMMHDIGQQQKYRKIIDDGHRRSIAERFVPPGGESSGSPAPNPSGPSKAEFNKLVRERFTQAEEVRREEEAAIARRRNEKAMRAATMEAISAEQREDQERRYRETIQGYKRVAEREREQASSSHLRREDARSAGTRG
jgi:hypothetical protein